MSNEDGNCAKCYGEAPKAQRAVRLTAFCDYPVCGLCEARLREGLVHYEPSNGDEFMIFEGRCFTCRHHRNNERGFDLCAYGILNKLVRGMMEKSDSPVFWFTPDQLRDGECLRYTPKDDPDGAMRDPLPPDAEGQLFLGDVASSGNAIGRTKMPITRG